MSALEHSSSLWIAHPAAKLQATLKVHKSAYSRPTTVLAEVTYPAEREYLHGQLQYKALVQFDAPEIRRGAYTAYKAHEAAA